MWLVYILETQSRKFYIGLTDNLQRRYSEHKNGKGGFFTSYDRPQKLVYSERYENRSEAESREKQLKGWSRAKKIALIKGDNSRLRQLSVSRD